MTDIRMDGQWQLTQAADGDAPTVTGTEALLQEIRLEAVTQEGELFHDVSFGWSLLDFIQQEENSLLRSEIENRITNKLLRYTEIEAGSVSVICQFIRDKLVIAVSFKLAGEAGLSGLTVSLDRTEVVIDAG